MEANEKSSQQPFDVNDIGDPVVKAREEQLARQADYTQFLYERGLGVDPRLARKSRKPTYSFIGF